MFLVEHRHDTAQRIQVAGGRLHCHNTLRCTNTFRFQSALQMTLKFGAGGMPMFALVSVCTKDFLLQR